MSPELSNHIESKTNRTIEQYNNYKTKLLTGSKFLCLSHENKKKTIIWAANNHPIQGATKQQIIEDLTLGALFDAQGKMTQFGFKNWAETTKNKLNKLRKTYDNKIQQIYKQYRKNDPNNKDNNSFADSFTKVEFTDPKQEQIITILHNEIANKILPAMRYCDKLLQTPESVDGTRDGFQKGLVAGGQIPFVTGLFEMADTYAVSQVNQKTNQNKKLTPGEQILLDSFIQLRQLNTQFDLGTSYNVGVGTAGAINFIIELAMTGGVTSLIKAGAQRGGQKLLQSSLIQSLKTATLKQTTKIAGKEAIKTIANKAAGKFIIKIGTKAVEYSRDQLITKTITAIGMTGLRPDMIANNTIGRMLDHFTPEFNEKGEITSLTKTKSGESFSLALMKGFTMTFTEFFTEQIGGDILNTLSKVKGKGVSKFIEHAQKYGFGIKFLDALGKSEAFIKWFGKRLVNNKIVQTRSQLTPSSGKEFIEQTLMRSNPFGEYFEEFLSGRVKHYLDNESIFAIKTQKEWETFLVCFMTGQAVTIGGVGVGAYQAISNTGSKAKSENKSESNIQYWKNSQYYENMTNDISNNTADLDIISIKSRTIDQSTILVPPIGSICRSTDQSQIDDMISTGFVRPNQNNRKMMDRRRYGQATRVNRSRIDKNSGYTRGDYYVLQVNSNTLSDGSSNAISLNELEAVWKFDEQKNNWINILPDLKIQYHNKIETENKEKNNISGSTNQQEYTNPDQRKSDINYWIKSLTTDKINEIIKNQDTKDSFINQKGYKVTFTIVEKKQILQKLTQVLSDAKEGGEKKEQQQIKSDHKLKHTTSELQKSQQKLLTLTGINFSDIINPQELINIFEQQQNLGLVIKQSDGSWKCYVKPGVESNLSLKQYLQVRTIDFKNWFGDRQNNPENASKVVDQNGEPMVVYHWSNTEIDKFTIPEKPKNGVGLGKGIYFTFYGIKNNYTETFGSNLHGCFLNIKQLYLGANISKGWTPTTSQGMIFGYSKEQAKNHIDTAFNPLIQRYESDVDSIDEFIESFKQGSLEDIKNLKILFEHQNNGGKIIPTLEEYRNLRKNITLKHYKNQISKLHEEKNTMIGMIDKYDGMTTRSNINHSINQEDQIIVKNPNQIKSATNNSGKFDATNENINDH